MKFPFLLGVLLAVNLAVSPRLRSAEKPVLTAEDIAFSLDITAWVSSLDVKGAEYVLSVQSISAGGKLSGPILETVVFPTDRSTNKVVVTARPVEGETRLTLQAKLRLPLNPEFRQSCRCLVFSLCRRLSPQGITFSVESAMRRLSNCGRIFP